MNTKPLVSVVMPVYNGEKYLREAIDSILNQAFKDFEFIIINDGSTDKSEEIIKSYNDNRIRLISQNNLKLIKSLNKGVKLAVGKYIARMDADDISLPERLEKEVEFLNRNQDVCLVGTYSFVIGPDGKVIDTWKGFSENKKIKENLLICNQFCHGSVIFRKKCIEDVGFYREELGVMSDYIGDYDLWLRISERWNIANIPEILYKHRINPNSISVQKSGKQGKCKKFAIKLAKERRQYGKDMLQVGDRRNIDKVLMKVYPTSWIETRKNLIQNDYLWGKYLYSKDDYKGAIGFFIRPFPYNLFNIDIVSLILKAMIKSVVPKKTISRFIKKK